VPTATQEHLPPGSTAPSWFQTVNWQTRPIAFFERCRARYGKRFTVRLMATPPFVFVTDPDEIKQVFTAPPDVLHPGEGARILEPVVGANSVILLDENPHITQRKLMLPAFHGERMKRLTGLMTEVAEREVESWPTDRPMESHPRFQALTLEVILRAVFGLDPGPRLERLRTLLTRMATEAVKPFSALPQLQDDWNPRWRRFVARRAEVDQMLYEQVDERRAEGGDRDDVLSMLLEARHEDGSPMSHSELRDELMTLLVAGHETTASSLAWSFERLVREPRVVARLQQEIDSGDGEEYLTATVQETLRARPVLPNSAPRLVRKPVEIGGWSYEPDPPVVVSPCAYLVHHDPDIYDDPYTFRPERFLDEPPGTYTWIPFGGGRRRCLGASFALMEMKIVLRAVLERRDLRDAGRGLERSRRRSITIAPRAGGAAVLPEREARPAELPAEPAAA
jgi:cytochrome P450